MPKLTAYFVVLGVVMVSVLAEGNGFLRRPHVVRFYVMFKIPSKYEQRFLISPNPTVPSPVPPALLLDDSAGSITRELWWTNQEFSSHFGFSCSHIT